MNIKLVFCIIFTIILIVYFRREKIVMIEAMVDGTTELASLTHQDIADDQPPVVNELKKKLINSVLNKVELEKLLENSDNKDPFSRFHSSEIVNDVLSYKNEMKLLENDTLLRTLKSEITRLNDMNPSVSELIVKYKSK